MNKKILFAFLGLLITLPIITSAQVSDVDPQGTSSCVSITNNLRYRSTDAQVGGDVTALQDFLQSSGYLRVGPSGYFGLLTTKGVKAFQSDNVISPTGYVGPITRAKISAVSCSGTPSGSGNSVNIPTNSTSNNQNGTTIVSGCASGAVFSSTTGAPCSTNTSTTRVAQNMQAATITGIQSVANPLGTVDANHKASIYGTGLKGKLIIKIGNQEPQTVIATGSSDSYADFFVPSRSQSSVVSIIVTNDSSIASNFYQVNINVPNVTVVSPTAISSTEGCVVGRMFSITTGVRCPGSNEDNVDRPILSSISMTSATPGTTIVIHGSNFLKLYTLVTFSGNGVTQNVSPNSISSDGSELSVIVPYDLGVGSYSLQIVNLGNSKSISSTNSINLNVVQNTTTQPATITVLSPKSGDIWQQGLGYTISWDPYSGDFDHYRVLMSNHAVPGVQGGSTPLPDVSKNYASVSINPENLTNNFIQGWIQNSGGTASEQSVRNSFYYEVQAVKDTDMGPSRPSNITVVAKGEGGTFSIVPLQITNPTFFTPVISPPPSNLYPAIAKIDGPVSAGGTTNTQVGTSISIIGQFGTGANHGGAKTTTWNFGDGATQVANYSSNTATGGVAGSHAYTAAGTYTVTLTFTTTDGTTATSSPIYVKVI